MSKIEKNKATLDVEKTDKVTPVAVDAKIKAIEESKMPQWQKDQCKVELIGKKSDGEKISFEVYVLRKRVPKHLNPGMRAYPKAKGIMSATMGQWEEIFKDF